MSLNGMAESRRLWCHRRVWLKCSKTVARESQVLQVRACRRFNKGCKTIRQAQAPSPVFFIEAPGRPVFFLPSGSRGWRARWRAVVGSRIRLSSRTCGSASRRATRTAFNARARGRLAYASPTVINGIAAPGRAFRAPSDRGSPIRGCRRAFTGIAVTSDGTLRQDRRQASRLQRQPAPGRRLVLATGGAPAHPHLRCKRHVPATAPRPAVWRRL